MRKLMLAAAALVSLPFAVPAAAQEDVCVTRDTVMARAVELKMPVFYTLASVDIGDEDKAEVVIFEADGAYLAVAFERNCYAGYHAMDSDEVEKFINDNQRKADGA